MSISDATKSRVGNDEGPEREHVTNVPLMPSLESVFDDQLKLVEKLFLDKDSTKIPLATKSSKQKNKKSKNPSVQPSSSRSDDCDGSRISYADGDNKKYTGSNSSDRYKVTHCSRIYRFDDVPSVSVGCQHPDDVSSYQKPLMAPSPRRNSTHSDIDDEESVRSAMLRSWYDAGYRTGYYEAMMIYKHRDCKK